MRTKVIVDAMKRAATFNGCCVNGGCQKFMHYKFAQRLYRDLFVQFIEDDGHEVGMLAGTEALVYLP